MAEKPKVTVLMPVYNGEKHLREALESILKQTFTQFELLIIDDGSTDESVAIVRSYADPRIRLVFNGKNIGLSETINKGMQLARGRYVARMDCDDISHPDRLALQVSYMDSHEDVAVCGSAIKVFGSQRFVKRYPLSDNLIRIQMLFECALAHPAVLIRRELLISQSLFYYNNYARAEDYDLWTRMPWDLKFANLNQILLYYRQHPQQVSAAFSCNQFTQTNAIRKRQLERLGLKLTAKSLDIHQKISQKKPEPSISFLNDAASWLLSLQEKNEQAGLYDNAAFAEITGMYWWTTCFHAKSLGFQAWKIYFASRLSRQANIGKAHIVVFWLKCLLRIRY